MSELIYAAGCHTRGFGVWQLRWYQSMVMQCQ